MKLEFLTEDKGGLTEHSAIYITKSEFIKAYESDKRKAFFDLNGIIEMFTSPACFNTSISQTAFEKVYEHLQKTTYKGLLFSYGETENGETDMLIELVKR